MKSYSLVRHQGDLRNRQKSARELQNANLDRPTDKERSKNISDTAQQLGLRIAKKNEPAFLASQAQKKKAEDVYLQYTPTTASGAVSKTRVIQIAQQQEDPLEPPRHKHKKVPRGDGDPPPVILRSPPRSVTAQDQKDWKVPACISNWKNAAGYTVPMHMRLQADGRGLQDTTINERHAQFADALYAAERQARKEIQERSKIQQGLRMAQAEKKEDHIRKMAALARAEKAALLESSLRERDANAGESSNKGPETGAYGPGAGAAGSASPQSDSGIKSRKRTNIERQEEEAKRERDAIRAQRRREIIREDRMERAGIKKSKTERDGDRDISEKIALGQAQPTRKEAMFDQRLFNQTAGLDSGFGHDEDYTLYDKPLFADRTAASIYKSVNRNGPDQDDQTDDQKTQRVRKILGQSSTPADEKINHEGSGRAKPVEFEKRTLESQADFVGGLQKKK